MIICGLKLTHDGAIALLDDNKLVFGIEIEKIANNPRYKDIVDTKVIVETLKMQGYAIDQIDHFAIDGWGGYNEEALALQPRLRIGKYSNCLAMADHSAKFEIDIAQYHERNLSDNILERSNFSGLRIAGHEFSYDSYLHVTGHVMSAYYTSPFAARNESAFVLVWDGGMFPRLYYFDAEQVKVENCGPIFLWIGNIYTIFSQHFGPFKVNGNFAKDDLSIAGKVMAYIALGNVQRDLFPLFKDIYMQHYDKPMGFANKFANEFKKQSKGLNVSDEDILCSFHTYLEELLIEKLQKKMQRLNKEAKNLCFVGGCALNIKWNSGIRDSKIFENMYVPPFPNDSGSAIGAACASAYHYSRITALDWNVYAGPMIKYTDDLPSDWERKPCSLSSVAAILHGSDEPLVFLHGKAELGPRALGNRSILGAATNQRMKAILNQVKNREHYRPVSPICLEHQAKQIFEPGVSDPYMLFDHQVKSKWLAKIPAICHLDGSARLQTVSCTDNPVIFELLSEYEKLSGIPLLCNTSANFNGSGFFPDVASAVRWGKVNYVWSDGILFEKKHKIQFESSEEMIASSYGK